MLIENRIAAPSTDREFTASGVSKLRQSESSLGPLQTPARSIQESLMTRTPIEQVTSKTWTSGLVQSAVSMDQQIGELRHWESEISNIKTISIASEERTTVSSNKRKTFDKLENSLFAAFEGETLEDGMIHPAEEIIRRSITSDDELEVFERLRDIALDSSRPAFASSVLRCLGRQNQIGSVGWRRNLVQAGLVDASIEMRDAAVQAAATWGDHGLRTVLKKHVEPVSWLKDYIDDVVDEIG